MKKVVTLTVIAMSCLAFNAQSSDKLSGSEILAVQKGGVPDKVYTQEKPHLKVASYNIGKNETTENVSDFTQLNSAIKRIDAEIIAVSEVDNKTQRSHKIDQLKTIAEANNMHYAFGKALDFDGGEYGVVEIVARELTLPLNVMCMPELPDFKRLQQLGVRRISMGNFVHAQLQLRLKKLMASIQSQQSFVGVFHDESH